MSEDKKLSDILREEMNKLQTEVKQLKERLLSTEKQSLTTSTSVEEQKGHKDIKELVDCPNCYPEIERLVTPKVLKTYGEKLRGHELWKCKECGLPVKTDEKACPGCGNTKAKL